MIPLVESVVVVGLWASPGWAAASVADEEDLHVLIEHGEHLVRAGGVASPGLVGADLVDEEVLAGGHDVHTVAGRDEPRETSDSLDGDADADVALCDPLAVCHLCDLRIDEQPVDQQEVGGERNERDLASDRVSVQHRVVGPELRRDLVPDEVRLGQSPLPGEAFGYRLVDPEDRHQDRARLARSCVPCR